MRQDEFPKLRTTLYLNACPKLDHYVRDLAHLSPSIPKKAHATYVLPRIVLQSIADWSQTLVFRCNPDVEDSIEVLRCFTDEDKENENYSVAWSRASNGDPLVLVGSGKAKVNILNVRTGQLVQTLSGHGGHIYELAVCPTDPEILASASEDHSIRLWSLNPTYQRQPTVAIAHGEGHRAGVIALDFHRKGQYLLSGALETTVNLWLLPKNIKENLGNDKPIGMHYPHFSSTEVHSEYVDCVRFHNDLILSRAARGTQVAEEEQQQEEEEEEKEAGEDAITMEKLKKVKAAKKRKKKGQKVEQEPPNFILLWKIDGFNSDSPPPKSPPVPPSQTVPTGDTPISVPTSTLSGTRSAWGGRFQRLLQFQHPDSDIWWLRMNLFHEYGRPPILAAGSCSGGGSSSSKIFFWDLQRLETADALEKDSSLLQTKTSELQNEDTSDAASTATSSTESKRATPRARAYKNKPSHRIGQSIGDPFSFIAPHNEVIIRKPQKLRSQEATLHSIAWSRGGDWCVACGKSGLIVIMKTEPVVD